MNQWLICFHNKVLTSNDLDLPQGHDQGHIYALTIDNRFELQVRITHMLSIPV